MAEELFYAKQDNPQEACGFLNGMISGLDKFLDDERDLEAPLLLQHPSLLHFCMMAHQQIKELKAYKDAGWQFSLYDMLMMRATASRYKAICKRIYDCFSKTLNQYGGWLVGDWADRECLEFYEENCQGSADDELNVDFLKETNKESLDARGKIHSALYRIEQVELAELKLGKDILDAICPDAEAIAMHFENAARNHAKEFDKRTLRDLKREVQRYKPSRSATRTPEIWGLLMENENKAFELAVRGELVKSDDEHYEAFTEDMRKEMENSYDLMQKILNVSTDDGLFDFEYAAEPHINFFGSLSQNNYELVLELILRHNIIRCETFPELKAEFEQWKNYEEDEERLSEVDQALLNRLLVYISKADWQAPATSDKVKKFFRTLFGDDREQLEAADLDNTRLFREFFKTGRGGNTADRVVISMANILGYMKRFQLLTNSSQQISNDVFGNTNQVGNIDKGHDRNASQSFANLEVLMDKYRQKIMGM